MLSIQVVIEMAVKAGVFPASQAKFVGELYEKVVVTNNELVRVAEEQAKSSSDKDLPVSE